METEINTDGAETNEAGTPTVTSEASERTGTASPRMGGQTRRWLRPGAG